MTLPGWGRKVLPLAIIPVPQILSAVLKSKIHKPGLYMYVYNYIKQPLLLEQLMNRHEYRPGHMFNVDPGYGPVCWRSRQTLTYRPGSPLVRGIHHILSVEETSCLWETTYHQCQHFQDKEYLGKQSY